MKLAPKALKASAVPRVSKAYVAQLARVDQMAYKGRKEVQERMAKMAEALRASHRPLTAI